MLKRKLDENQSQKILKIFGIFSLLLMLNACQHRDDFDASENDSPKQQSFAFSDYADLEDLFKAWRAFEEPPLLDGAPDYRRETFEARQPEYIRLREQLESIDTSGWPDAHKVDWTIVWAEMNGYDFNRRILKPWARDPAFYKSVWTYRSDVPAHEGPTHHGTTELWTYDFPLSEEAAARLQADLELIPALNRQAQQNLVGNARDLWIAGIRDIENQVSDLEKLLEDKSVQNFESLIEAIKAAIRTTQELAEWLHKQAKAKTGPSGIGKENYTWYLQNVHLVPLSWEDEVMILKRELARAWSSLKLEEHRNRNIPQLIDVNSPEAYNQLMDQGAASLLQFLEKEGIVSVKDYWEPALRAQLGEFIPRDKRNFFRIGQHIDPRPLFSHFYHWFELARMDTEPHKSLIRREALLYNIFDSRNEGVATAVEEMFMQAGLYDDSPRSKEIVYIMIAQRAARGLGSLYAHANEMSMEEAGGIHSEYTPRGWMKTEKELLLFEQHLYLRQPGYGTSYITGKYLMENAMAEYARHQELKGETFELKAFFDELNRIGCIPMALVEWEMTGSQKALGSIGAGSQTASK